VAYGGRGIIREVAFGGRGVLLWEECYKRGGRRIIREVAYGWRRSIIRGVGREL
jgi:hypothetical protein